MNPSAKNIIDVSILSTKLNSFIHVFFYLGKFFKISIDKLMLLDRYRNLFRKTILCNSINYTKINSFGFSSQILINFL